MGVFLKSVSARSSCISPNPFRRGIAMSVIIKSLLAISSNNHFKT